MRTSPFSFHELHNTKTIQKPKSFSKIKTFILTTLYSYHNFVQKNEGVSQGHKHLLIY
jgi:hypothetical protein